MSKIALLRSSVPNLGLCCLRPVCWILVPLDWRRLGPLWEGGEASTGRASPGFSYVDLMSLLVSVATKLCQAFPVAPGLRDSCISDNMRIQCR
eukprot:1151184-Pelagomonas_calceolata.AAC.1